MEIETIPSTITKVSVTVTPDPADKNKVTITCNPDPVVVGVCDTLISFSLDTSGYRFKTDGAIVLKEADPDFPYDSWTISPTHAALLDLCNTNQTFGYSVFIVRTSDGKEFSVDPFIQNSNTTNC
jgi:hypothetical protein